MPSLRRVARRAALVSRSNANNPASAANIHLYVPAAAMLSGDDFAAVLKSRERQRSAHFSLHWRRNPASAAEGVIEARLGLVVAKKLARTSVRRNLVKRQTRMLFSQWLRESNGRPRTSAAWDVVLKLTANVASLQRAEQFREIAGLMRSLPGA